MPIKKKKDTEENRAFWAFVEETSKSVEEHFPAWKRGDVDQEICNTSNGNSSQNPSSRGTQGDPGVKFN